MSDLTPIGTLDCGSEGWAFRPWGRFHGDTPNLAVRSTLFDIVRCGEDNLLPQQALELKQRSPTLGGIIERQTDLICGRTVGTPDPALAAWMKGCNDGRGYTTLRRMLAEDLKTYNWCVVGVRMRKDGSGVEDLFWQDASWVRKGWRQPTDEEKETWKAQGFPMTNGFQAEALKVCNNWYNPTTSKGFYGYVECFEYFRPGEDCGEVSYVLIERTIQGYQWYPLPPYYSCWEDARADVEIGHYRSSIARSSFTAAGVVVVPRGTASTEDAEKLETDMQSLAGGRSAGRYLVMEKREGADKVEFFEFTQVFNDKNSLSDFQNSTTEAIAKANGLPSLTVIGLPGGPSLNGDANTITAALLAYQRKMMPDRELIDGKLEWLLQFAGFPNAVIEVENEVFDPSLAEIGEDDTDPALAAMRNSWEGIKEARETVAAVGRGEIPPESGRGLLEAMGYGADEILKILPLGMTVNPPAKQPFYKRIGL